MGAGPDSIDPEGVLDGIRWGAVVFGVVVDLAASLVVTIPMLLILAGPDAFSENEAIAQAAQAQALESDFATLVGVVVGLFCTVIGAFVGARRAACHFVRHGGWIGVGSLVLGVALIAMLPPEPASPLWADMTSLLGIVPAGMAGGLLAAFVSGDVDERAD